jgi:hypothetical protein
VDPDFLQSRQEARVVTGDVARIGVRRSREADRSANAECRK